jgi:hypothetical protein
MQTVREFYYKHMRHIHKDWSRKASWRDQHINERAWLADTFQAKAENGMVAIVREGMDCDCTQYRTVVHIPVPLSVFAFQKGEEDHREWLDGPESMWIAKPSEEPRGHKSRDRALEAYEDGHPHVVYYGDIDGD